MIRSLFLSADPVNTPRIDLVKECNDIESLLRLVGIRDQFEIITPYITSLSELQRALVQFEPHIVHFSGYGSNESSLILQHAGDIPEEVDSEILSVLFSILNRDVPCIVLSMCYSEKQAEAISEHVGCVVGLPKTMSYEAANTFIEGYYKTLGIGRTIGEAFAIGMNDLENLALDKDITPILLKKHGEDILQLKLTENRSFTPKKTSASNELEISEVKAKLTRTLRRPPLRKLITLQSQFDVQELRKIRTLTNDLGKEYYKVVKGERSLNDFYKMTLPIFNELLHDQQTTEAEKIRLSLASLYDYMQEFLLLKDIGDETEAELLNKKISNGINSILNTLKKYYSR